MKRKRMYEQDLLGKETLLKLNTIRLLAYKKRLLRVPGDKSSEDDGIRRVHPQYLHKQHPAWQEAMAELKKVLKTRENIARKANSSDTV